MFLQRKTIAVKYDDALDTLPSRATLCYESFEISLIRSFTSASVMPVAMAIISTDAPEANNLWIVAFFSFSRPSALPSIRTPSNTLIVSRFFFNALSYCRRSARDRYFGL